MYRVMLRMEVTDGLHERFDEDPAHAWLRGLLATTTRGFGLKERPRKRSW